jgi:hypothetical protein
MRTLAVLRTASPEASVLTAIALALLVAKTLVLNRYPAPLFGVYELGLLLEAILASVVASYVFYLFVVHLKEVGDRSTVAPYLDRHTLRVVGDCESQLAEIAKASAVPLSLDSLTLSSLTQAFAKIAPYSNAPLILSPANTHANWFQYFDFHVTRTRGSIARVVAQLIYLDAKHVSLLVSIDDCTLFAFMPQLQHVKANNSDLSPFASMFHSYCEKCIALKTYIAEKRSQ